jgi:hypothetical protein
MNQERYQQQVRRCTADLRECFPRLARRHTTLILIAALMEHVGGALFLSQEAHICTPEKVRAVIERVRQLAFTA